MVEEAKRGYIYEYSDGKCTDTRYMLILSNNSRSSDKIVNTLMLGDSSLGHDVVKIENDAVGSVKYVHCGMLTYARRENLVKEIGKISDEEMSKVEYVLCHELAIMEELVSERNFYKNAYNELLNRVMDKLTNI